MPYSRVESTDVRTGQTTVTVVPWTHDTILSRVADIRYVCEVGGCSCPIEPSLRLDTSRESQALLTSALLAAQLDPTRKFQWKFVDGSLRQRSGVQVTQMGLAVLSHVQQCRQREADLATLIKQTSSSVLDAIEPQLTAGWPS